MRYSPKSKRFAFCVGFFVLFCSYSSAQVIEPGLWNSKPIALNKLLQKCHFPVFLPKGPKGHIEVEKYYLAWVSKDNLRWPKLPARRAACFFLHVKSVPVVIIEVKSLPDVASSEGQFPNDNLYQCVAQGYFFGGVKNGTTLHPGRRAGTDFLILMPGTGAAAEEVSHMLIQVR